MSKSANQRPSPGNALNEADVGRCIHAVVAGLLADRVRSPRPEQLISATASILSMQGWTGAYRQAAKQRVLAGASLYFLLFLPSSKWLFQGAEVSVKARPLDLLWGQRSGEVMADELKSGRAAGLDSGRLLRAQVAAQVSAGAEQFGADFVGVRAILLAAPRRSFLLCPDGEPEALDL